MLARLTALLFALAIACLAANAQSPSWQQLKTFYQYDATEPLEVKETPAEHPDFSLLRLTYSGFEGETVPALLARPKGDEKLPAVLLLHEMGGAKEAMLEKLGRRLVEAGYAVLAIDTAYQRERAKSPIAQLDPSTLKRLFQTTVIDARRGLDYLRTRRDIDRKKIAIVGYSFGAAPAIIAASVDNRFAAVGSLMGGDTGRFRVDLAESRDDAEFLVTTNFVSKLTPRALIMVNGKTDPVAGQEVAQRLYDAARDPKEMIWIETDHTLSQQAIDVLLERLGEKLK